MNDKLIHAEGKFGMKPFRRHPLPDFTLEDLTDMGCTFTETENTKMMEIPSLAQMKLVESLKNYGFGASKGIDELLHKVLKLAGFDGRVQTKCDDQTYSLIAWQSK